MFYVDPSNTKKSWKGRPLTNQFAKPTPDSSGNVGFAVNGTGTFKRIFSGNYAGYDILPTDVVYRYDLGGTGCHYHGNDVTINAGQTATWSCDYYIDPTTTGYPQTNYLANFEGVVGGSASDPTPAIVGVWKRFTFSSTASSTGTCRMLLYPGACGDRLATGGFVLFKNPQVEFDSPGSSASPFIDGTRTTSQVLLDMTGNTTPVASSLTYASDGTFSLNGTTDYIDVGKTCTDLGLTTAATFDGWIYPTSNGSTYVLSDWNGTGITLRTNSNLSADFYIYPNNYRITYTYAFDANKWYNLVGVANGNMMYLYVNGQLAASTALGNAIGTSPSTLKIGCRGDGGSSYGKIGAIKIYKRPLTSTEVLQNFNALRGRYGL